jgi:hypothetical protein
MTERQQTIPAQIVGEPAIRRLRQAGFAVVPFDVPDYAVGEVMTWTGCTCPNRAWEAINCALNWMAVELPRNADTLALLGSGTITLEDFWRSLCREEENADAE